MKRVGEWMVATLAVFVFLSFLLMPKIGVRLECPVPPEHQSFGVGLSLECGGKAGDPWQQLPPRWMLESQGGLANGTTTMADRRTKVLFLSDYVAYTTAMSRWFFHMFEASRGLPGWDVYLWGPGFPKFGTLCHCRNKFDTAADNIVLCNNISGNATTWRQLNSDVDVHDENNEDDTSSKEPCAEPTPLTLAEELSHFFDAENKPFDFLLPYLKLDTPPDFYKGLHNHTKIVMYDHEWHKWTLKNAEIMKPDVIFHTYVDNFEENLALRLANSVSRETVRKYSVVEDHVLNRADLSNRGTSVGRNLSWDALGLDVLVGYGPLGVLPHCNTDYIYAEEHEILDGGRGRPPVDQLHDVTAENAPFNNASEDLAAEVPNVSVPAKSRIMAELGQNETTVRSQLENPKRPIEFLLVGFPSFVFYPTRSVLMAAVNSNFLRMRDRVHVVKHPGYFTNLSDGQDCASSFARHVEDYAHYIQLMEQSRICFIGRIGSWTIRKYKEAMASGCLVVGDLPADTHLSRFVIDAQLIQPANVNLRYDEDASAFSDLLGTSAPLPSRFERLTAEARNRPPIRNNELLVRGAASRLARRLSQIAEDHANGVFDELIREAKVVARRDYAWQSILTDWIAPAVLAHRNGERGWFRTPTYFRKHGRKYETRHRYLLTEWLLNRRGFNSPQVDPSSRLAEVVSYVEKPFESLLAEAEGFLIAENQKRCLEVDEQSLGDRGQGAGCLESHELFFDGMSDHDIRFIKARGVYADKVALDGVTHEDLWAPSLYM